MQLYRAIPLILAVSFSLMAQENGQNRTKEASESKDSIEKNETKESATKEKKWQSAQIQVIGESKKELKRIPGSAIILDKKYLEETKPMDGMEAMKKVPGVAIRYQDPIGLTMNLGFRGVSNEVSRKVLILEDGVPVSLNPYGEPEMYYTPSIERMERVEVVKGSGSILFGPSTIGGVVNLITKRPPKTPIFYTTTMGGENGYLSSYTGFGGTFGNTGVDVNVLRKQGEGFRQHQSFRVNEFNFKSSTQLNEKHALTTKMGYHHQEASVTYVGLTSGMFNGYGTKKTIYNPYLPSSENKLNQPGTFSKNGSKFNPAEQDRRLIERMSLSLGHEWKFTENWKLVTKVYGYTTTRNWARQDYTRNTKVNEQPPTTTLTMLDGEPFTDRPGDSLWMRNTATHRDRKYQTAGIESRLQGDFKVGDIKNELDFGMRYHYDQAFVQLLSGVDTPDYAIPNNLNNLNAGYKTFSSPYSLSKSGTLRDDEYRQAKASSFWIQNRILVTDKLSIIPGIRYEAIHQSRLIKRRQQNFDELSYTSSGASVQVDQEGKSRTHIALPGFGMTYDILENLTLFAGAHRGFAPPRYESAISPTANDLSLKSETSWNYEAGVRGDATDYFYTQVAGYFLDFQDQIVNSSAAGGNLGSRPVNAGKSTHKGVELTFAFDLGTFLNKPFKLVFEMNSSLNNAKSNQYTYNLKAWQAGNPDIRQHQDTNGNYLPYVSREVHVLGISFSLPAGFYSRVEYQYFSKQYHDLENTKTVYWYDAMSANDQTNLNYLNIRSNASGTNGVISEYGLVNASFGFKHPEKKWAIFINGKNLQDRKYISTRLPEGIQPGPYRQINFGFSLEL